MHPIIAIIIAAALTLLTLSCWITDALTPPNTRTVKKAITTAITWTQIAAFTTCSLILQIASYTYDLRGYIRYLAEYLTQ